MKPAEFRPAEKYDTNPYYDTIEWPGYVEPTGTIEITENGEVDVTQYAKADVNVEASDGGGGDATEYAIVCYECEYNNETAEVTMTQIPTCVFEVEWKIDSENAGGYGWLPKTDDPVDKAAAGTFLAFNANSGIVYFTVEDFLSFKGNNVPANDNVWVMPSHDVVCCIEKPSDDGSETT